MDQLLSAIAIVSDPTQNRELQAQAIEYLNTIRTNPEQSWQLALNLFVDAKPDGSRAHDQQIRAFALQILDDLLNNRIIPLDDLTSITIRDKLLAYIQSEYVLGPAESHAQFIRNKFSHTLALFFVTTYPHQWSDFFKTQYELLRTKPAANGVMSSSLSYNPNVSALFLRFLIELSGEIADALLKDARVFAGDRHKRDGLLRDHVRERDSKDISDVVLAIIADTESHLVSVRSGGEAGIVSALEELVGLAVKAFASLIPWININFTVTPDTVPLLFRLLSDPSQLVRIETSNAFLRMILKGLKEPQDKIQLLRVLSLREVLESLEASTRDQQEAHVLFRESLGKLANGLGLELCKLIDEAALTPDMRSSAVQMLNELLPVTLRFLADEWDDTSQTVHQLISTVLGTYKRARKNAPHTHMNEQKRQFLSSLLDVTLQKMKWDPDTDEADPDEDDKAAFETMRKELKTFLDGVLVIDEELVNSFVRSKVIEILRAHQTGTHLAWVDVELAVHLVYLYGELQKGVKGVGQFVQLPPEARPDPTLRGKPPPRPRLNLAEFPLTPFGEMMMTLIQSNVFAYHHSFVANMAFETVGRYGDFFKTRTECIVPVLTAFIGPMGIHNPRENLRGRLFYLFHRFILNIRSEIPQDAVLSILNGIGDLLTLNVELPDEDSPQEDVLEAAVTTPTLFDSQIYLFETVGNLLSLLGNAPAEQVALLQTLVSPLLKSLEEALQTPMLGPQDVLPVLKVHHFIRALGNISKGFPDAPVPTPPSYTPPAWVAVIDQAADAILVSLSRLSQYKIVREATRFAFARIIASCGPTTAKYIPQLMAAMLTSCKPDELADFINFLGLIVHKLQFEIFAVLDELVGPLFRHMAALLGKPIDGTDAKQEHLQTRKAYLDVLLTIMSGPLFVVFLSDRNETLVEPLCQLVLTIASDPSDPPSQRVAWTVLARFTTHFGKTQTEFEKHAAERVAANLPPEEYHPIAGYETFIYERLIPLAFEVPNQPGYNIKDGQALQVLQEVGTLLVAIRKARGQEALEYYSKIFLPSKGWPQEASQDFINQLVTLDTKGFKKYWSDFVRRSVQAAAESR